MKCFGFSLTVFFLLLSMGCSSGFDSVSPDTGSITTGEQFSSSLAVSDFDNNGNPSAGYGALGFFKVVVDTRSLNAEIIPLRDANLTDVVEVVDITNFLQMTPCVNCVDLKSVRLDEDGNIVLRIGIKHPFDAGNASLPVSGKNRGDLHVFNVEGVVVGESSTLTFFPAIGQGIANFRLLNADGYSEYLDMTLQPYYFATIHPYKLHFADYTKGNFDASNPMGFSSVTDPPPSGNLVMAMGCDYDYQDYKFSIDTSDTFTFLYAVECTYALASSSRATRFQPDYRLPQHNKKAASKVDVRITDNSLVSGDNTSSASIAVDIVDMNHGVSVGENRDQMLYNSSVAYVRIDIPQIFNGYKDIPLVNVGGNGHSDADPLTYNITIENEKSAPAGQYKGLIKVLDSYPPGSNPSAAPDGIGRVDPGKNMETGYITIPNFATYQVFEIEVFENPVSDPVAILLPDPVGIYEGQSVLFDAGTSYDPDGSIVTYEFMWDWDRVPSNFVADISGSSAVVTSTPYQAQGTYYAGLRVTDNSSAVAYDWVVVNVAICDLSCPLMPFMGGQITNNFTFSPPAFSLYDDYWNDYADQIIDVDVLSDGRGVAIYSDYNNFDGELRIFNSEGGEFTPLDPDNPDYPGEIGVSIDVDSEDNIVFVTSSLSQTPGNAVDIPLLERISATYNFFTVVNPDTGVSSAQIVNVGAIIQAVEIDENDDVWVIDSNSILKMYDKSNNYELDYCRQFDLNDATSGGFSDFVYVYDFVINFHNDAFFILTNETLHGTLWRIECDGSYDSNINGHLNPMTDTLPQDITNGKADIGIDNLNWLGNPLTGAQDLQIIVVGTYYGTKNCGMVARVDSELDQILTVNSTASDGLINVAVNQITNEMWGFEAGIYSDSYTESWSPPTDWQ
jgi:hypothetical protein